jgi:RIO kinase 1
MKKKRRMRREDEGLEPTGQDVALAEGDDEAPERSRRRQRPVEEPPAPKEAAPKTSYEANEDVQRWLWMQEQEFDDGRARAEFDPTFLASRRDRLWIMSSLEHFYDERLIDDVVREVKSGKEATVFSCVANPATGKEFLAAKVYRPRMFRALSNDAVYRNSRYAHDEEGNTVRNRRRVPQSGAKGRAFQVSSWIGYEFETHRMLYQAGAPVPEPIAFMGNAVLMDFIGDDGQPAPLLRSVRVPRTHAQRLFDTLIGAIETFLRCDRVHGDLSAYNVLYWRDEVVVIDLAQALDPRHSDEVYRMLERDVERICQYFERYGVRSNPQALAGDMWARYLMSEM